ncbi:MAG: histidine phosphatase family protein [Bryobacteraceae bacterium]
MTRRILLALTLFSSLGIAQTLSGDALVKALQQGGYVIVLRHASSPGAIPAGASERQLDEAGRASATAMGKALRDLKIPIGEVLSSPTYRALETVKYGQFGKAVETVELGDNAQSMAGGTPAQAAWLQKRVTQVPKGTNTILITHEPNLRDAFPAVGTAFAQGEALIFGPGSSLVARVKIEQWPSLLK